MLDQNEKPLKLASKDIKRMRKDVRQAMDNGIRLAGCEHVTVPPFLILLPPFDNYEHFEFVAAVNDEFVCQAVWHLVTKCGYQKAVRDTGAHYEGSARRLTTQY